MNQRERFHALFSGEKMDRLPVYYFGTWVETKARWKNEGLTQNFPMNTDYGPQIESMDDDWEEGMWNCHGFVNLFPVCHGENIVVEETEDYIITKYATGAVIKHGKKGSSINHTLEYALKPTRESWEIFKTYLDPKDPGRYADGWEEKAIKFAGRERVATFLGGSLYGWLRDWMGVEELSCLMFEDMALLDEMVGTITDYCIELLGPVAMKAQFDFVYIFEDCCGANGPLFSPAIYKSLFDRHYRKLIRFYKDVCKIPFALVDSDGVADELVPLWIESGFDIVFPVEVGKWNGSPDKLRKMYGNGFGMLGGVDKHLITIGGQTLRDHLTGLIPAVKSGRYLPIPDHRIPPEVSLEKFMEYIQIFKEVFSEVK